MYWTIGVDEVGLGCIAGPLVVCAFAAPRHWCAQVLVGDSKKMSPKLRSISAAGLREDKNVFYTLQVRSHGQIDSHGIRPVLKDATWTAVHELKKLLTGKPKVPIIGSPARIIVDGDVQYPGMEAIPKADATVREVGAASIVAKEYRDELMRLLAEEYKGYDFAENKGYPTAKHLAALHLRGPSPIHRKTFAPVKGYL